MEYPMVSEHNREKLIRKAAELIRQGWKLLGGIVVGVAAPLAKNYIYCQAMVKEQA